MRELSEEELLALNKMIWDGGMIRTYIDVESGELIQEYISPDGIYKRVEIDNA